MLSKETIQQVIVSQREFLDRSEQGVLRETKVSPEKSFALVITGIRRCGKSTFLNQLLQKQKKGYYLNLEDPRLEGFDLMDFNKAEIIMKELYGEDGIYFFDEIQNIEKWEKYIRYLVDKREAIIITGSNASLMSKELGIKLTGRQIRIEMFPFSFKEFLNMKNQRPSKESFEEYLYKCGFPEYLKKENPLILHELLSDIVMRDIVARFGIKNTVILKKMIAYLISNIGKEFSYNSLKKMFEIKSVQSVIDYISYFEDAYLIFTVPKFNYSYKQQQMTSKKIYSVDNGFSYNNSVSFSKDRGRMLENVVFLELRRKFKNIFYFQEKNECDFLIKEKDKIISAIQVCFEINEENKSREIDGLATALEKFDLEKGYILTYDQEDVFLVKNKKIIIKPVWKWLLERG